MIERHITIRRTNFSETELDGLQSLRARYQTARHLFTDRELAHLRFLRWLVRCPGWNGDLGRPA
jgi:hypothetical protein